MNSVSDAVRLVLNSTHRGPAELVRLDQGFGRTLAADISVPHDSPPFDKALMDGFAVSIGSDTRGIPNQEPKLRRFQLAETVTAGMVPTRKLESGLATRIMTGAMLPEGCNCVVPVEHVQSDPAGADEVMIDSSFLVPESSILRQGLSARQGAQLLRSGLRLQPQHIAALAEFGINRIPVNRRPRVAVLATGDELLGVDEPLIAGRIRNSNEPMLIAQIISAGAEPVPLGIARDTADDLQLHISRGLLCDFLLLTGGVSAGILDLVPAQLTAAGTRNIFHGVNMKPGKPLWFGVRTSENTKSPAPGNRVDAAMQQSENPTHPDGDRQVTDNSSVQCLVFGLPGNPVSSMVCFELFVRPALSRFLGNTDANPLTARLQEPFRVHGNRPTYQPAVVFEESGVLKATPVAWKSSADLTATTRANGMILLTPEHGDYHKEERVPVWIWGDRPFS